MKKVFIDGSSGTTGLRIRQRLSERSDIELLSLADEDRHDEAKRLSAIDEADVAFLCLPDQEALNICKLASGVDTVIIDTSTAHRTDPGWVYGMPELPGQHEKIKNSKRIANPGCHASGFIALIKPLVDAGLLKKEARITCTSLTGYSGGGKKMISEYENVSRGPGLDSPGTYALTQNHKHLKEMKAICGLDDPPAFMPVVGDFYSGMQTLIPLFSKDLNGDAEDVRKVLRSAYPSGVIRYSEEATESGFIYANEMAGSDGMRIGVSGNGERILLYALFDNLGKGASGAAVQNMNIALGLPETIGLKL
ncbi:MAG: N-acetyl-gamma-glutamyl-phosphate reductase [Clostridia bacterium]|nr:N-acetyl-gamma-glutamyl-phosphate reductase [Clostridia bacterium]